MSLFPITFEDKVDSPEFIAWLATFGAEKKLTAAEINLVRDALNELHTTKVPIVGGKIPTEYLPSYVDDVLEFANLASFPVIGESGKIYIALYSGFTYRWSGSVYVQIGGGGKLTENHLFASSGVFTLPNTQLNLHQSRFANLTILSNPGLTFGNGIPEPGGDLDLSYLSDVGNPRITGNYISKIKYVQLSYTRNASEFVTGQETNIMLSIMTDTKYFKNMQLVVRHNFVSNSSVANTENKVSIPILTHLPLDPFSNIKWCVRTNNATAQTFTTFRLNVITEEV